MELINLVGSTWNKSQNQNHMKNLITLNHSDQVKVETFKWSKKITVGTVEGFSKEMRESKLLQEAALKRAIKHGHDLAWANQQPSILTANYPGKEEEARKAAEAFAAAITLEEGQQVKIENRLYKVLIIGEQYSDPIHFQPLKNASIERCECCGLEFELGSMGDSEEFGLCCFTCLEDLQNQ